MDVDARYAELSSLAQSHMKTLKNIGANAIPRPGEYLGLGACCYRVINDGPRWGNCDAYNYLHTLNEFVGRIPAKSPSQRKIWDKISGNASAFLDTVVEAAWALYFSDNGDRIEFEVPLDPSIRNSKDADIVVELQGVKHWLDATSIQLSERTLPARVMPSPFGQIRLSDELIAKLADKARDKYHNKFDMARCSELFKNEAFGVLLCVLKLENRVDFLTEFDLALPPPDGLLDNDRPGLNLVWVHTLRAPEDSEILRPCTIAKWSSI